MTKKSKENRFLSAVEDHGVEGMEVLLETPSFLARALIYILIGLLLCIFLWSFFGKADVAVIAAGRLNPDTKTRSIYSPADGELIDIYVAEGMPVQEGDLLARLKAPGAIEAATNAFRAKSRFEKAEREKSLFPQRNSIMERERDGIQLQIEHKQNEYDQLTKLGMRNLEEDINNRVTDAKRQVSEAERRMNEEKAKFERLEKLFSTTDGGGISRMSVEEQENKYLSAVSEYNKSNTDMERMELEISKEYTKAREEIDNNEVELLKLRLELENKQHEIDTAAKDIEVELRSARAEWEAAQLVSFDNLDQNNFLVIRTPVAGDITNVFFDQIGEKIQSARPLVAIAPSNARKMLIITIPDMDRGLLKVGQKVMLKFAAFPYHRYGFITGRLEYISSAATSADKEQPLYEGRVSLDRDYFMVNDEAVQLRYGMTAIAEIVIQKRRMIDLILDPFRKTGK